MSEIQNSLISDAITHFQHLFGEAEVQVWTAPARINIIGEHIDYVSYLPTAALPFGSHEHQMIMVFRANRDRQIRGASLDKRFEPFSFPIPTQQSFRSQSWIDFLYASSIPSPDWSNYVKGAVFYAAHQWGISTGFDFVVASSIPAQGGASSSSALTVLAGVASRLLNHIDFSHSELAQESAQAEWFIGTRGGALDHTAICLANQRHAIHFQFANNCASLIPLPTRDYRWITFFTQAADKGREVMLEYNERAAVARLIIPAILGDMTTRDSALSLAWKSQVERSKTQGNNAGELHSIIEEALPSTMTLNQVRDQYPETYQACQQSFPSLTHAYPDKELKIKDRAAHHISEIERVAQAVNLLKSEHEDSLVMMSLGRILNESHASLSKLYEISIPAVERLHEILVMESRVLGARMIGGGFGGNVLALAKVENVDSIIERVQEQYYAPQHRNGLQEGAILVSTPGNGVRPVISV